MMVFIKYIIDKFFKRKLKQSKIPEFARKNLNPNIREISEIERKKVRDWYYKNMPEHIEENPKININNGFGCRCYGSGLNKGEGYRLCIGDRIYVRLYEYV